jgi:hypothetical protein
MGSLVSCTESVNLQRVLVREDGDQRLLIRAKALHGLAQSLRIRIGVPLNDLRRTVAQ